jgi:hypothetical protein
MKKFLFLFILTLNIILAQQKYIYYVAKDGNDAWSGKSPEKNAGKNEGPFASLNKALECIKTSNFTDNAEIIINIREGIYSFNEGIIINSEISSGKNNKITIKAYNQEKVVFSGGIELNGFTNVTDKKILERIDPENHSKIMQIDLKKQNITDYGKITPRSSPGLQLFFNDKCMTLARYPNKGWLKVYDVPQTGDSLFNKGLDREKRYDNVPVGRHYGRIKYDVDRPNAWKKDTNIYCHGYWTWDWSDGYQKVKSIDVEKKEVTFQAPHHGYGYTKNQRYYFLNILEELDTPGEWYLDRETGILYFIPPSDIKNGKAIVSMLEEPILTLSNTKNINIEKIKFSFSRSNGIVISGGKDNCIAGCTFCDLGKTAVLIEGGTNNGITSSNLYNLALGGMVIKGGDRKQLIPANNYAKNNHIYDYSKWVRSGQLGIELGGVGNIVSNNELHNAPHEGVYLHGNDNIIEYNEFFNLCNETGDAGAIHTGRNYTWRGNIIRHNYFHDLKGPGLHGVVAVYLDDFASGYTVYGNICLRAGRGTLIGGGRDNIVENNLYIKCQPTIVLDARGLGWASYYFDGTYNYLFDTLKAYNVTNPPYSVKYPVLVNILNDEPAVPKNNRIMHNISMGGRFIELLDYFAYDQKVNKIEENLIYDTEVLKRIKTKPAGWEPYYLNLDVGEGYYVFKNTDKEINNELKNNIISTEEIDIKKIITDKFKFENNPLVEKSGFKQIPFEKIGLYPDSFRKAK